jgi:hypothetical protein
MKRSVSIVCVVIGSLAVGAVSGRNLQFITSALDLSSYAFQQIDMAFILIAIFTAVAIFLSFFERFEHYITAILFGVSVPGLLYAFASLGAVQ